MSRRRICFAGKIAVVVWVTPYCLLVEKVLKRRRTGREMSERSFGDGKNGNSECVLRIARKEREGWGRTARSERKSAVSPQ